MWLESGSIATVARVGIGRPIRWYRESVTHIAYEPTGSYHRAMKRQLGDVGYPAVKATTR